MKRATLALVLLFPLASEAAISSSERSALVAIHGSTNGNSWSDSTNWLGASGTECTWAGVRCDEGQTTVTGLFLQENNLTGSLPSEIGNLTNLEDLELYGNAIGGPIPSSIGSLSKLRRLLLFDNQLSGSLPPTIGNLSSLESLFIDRNGLTGPLPSTVAGLASVKTFAINGNQLDGPLPAEIGQMSSLEYLDLSYNRIDGPLPSSIGMLSNLHTLYLNENEISGPIPGELSGATNLVSVNLGTNRLTGPIPSSLGSLPKLEFLTLFNNELTGSIPPSLGSLPAVQVVDAAQNQLSGSIPPELGNLATLRELWLQANVLTGAIPPELGNLQSLERLQLEGNALTGSIPSALGNLTNLLVLSVGGNAMSGSIPPSLGNLTKLVALGADSMSLTGPIPAELTGLTELVELVLYDNQLTGSIPSSIGNLTKMQFLLLGGNFLTGTIPPGITQMRDMIFLDLRGNTFTGTIPQDIGNLTKMTTFQVTGNALTGTIPASIGNCTALETLRLDYNRLEGTIPPQIGNLTNLRSLILFSNRLEGPLPPALFTLPSLESLRLGANRFDGAIPGALGNLTTLRDLDLSNCAFRGEVPSSITNLTNLGDGSSDFDFNALVTSSSSVRSFLSQKQWDGDWEGTQTIAPTGVKSSDDPGWGFEWTPIAYVDDEGGYRVDVSVDGSFDPPDEVYTTATKHENEIALDDLGPGSYSFRVRTVTHPHGLQQNTVESDPVELSGTKFFNILFLPEVRVGALPESLLQENETPVNSVTFPLLNVGTVEAEVELSQSGDFFTQSPTSFTIEPGESQTVTITSVAQPPGEYTGNSIVRYDNGFGTLELSVPVKLVSTGTVSGTAIAVPALPRLDLSAERSTNPTGSVSFTNVGDATLTGALQSDVSWLVPQSGLVTIPPSETRSVSFTVDRAQRPDGDEFSQDGAAFSGVLRLVYASGSGATARLNGHAPSDGSGIATSLVTVVDSVKPSVSVSGIPGLAAGEVGLVIPGVRSATTSLGSIVSDVSIANAYGVSGLSDLRVFYRPAGAPASVASFGSVRPRGSILLADAVSSVFSGGAPTGVAQVRTNDFNRILVGARLVTVRAGRGTYATSLPVFRTNRGADPSQTIHLTGLRGDASRTDIVVQSLGPDPATARIEYLDSSGALISSADPVNVGGWDVTELKSAVPDNAVTAIVTNRADSPSRLAAYAINWDDTSGDSWVVVDWNRYHAFGNSAAMKIPVARLAEASGPRRRPVRRSGAEAGPEESSVEAEGDVTGLDLSIFNPDPTPAIGTLTFVDNNGNAVSETLTLQARQTISIENVLATTFRRRGSANGYLTFTPDRGGFAISARLATAGGGEGTIGSTVPVLAQSSGLRLGQSQIFAALEDSRQATIDAKQGGSYRTQVSIVETTGRPVRVRASMLFYDGRSLAATVRSRDFDVDGSEIRTLGNIARAIIGDARETTLGDLHDFQVEFRVVAGEGAVTVFTETFDNGTGDWVLRTE